MHFALFGRERKGRRRKGDGGGEGEGEEDEEVELWEGGGADDAHRGLQQPEGIRAMAQGQTTFNTINNNFSTILHSFNNINNSVSTINSLNKINNILSTPSTTASQQSTASSQTTACMYTSSIKSVVVRNPRCCGKSTESKHEFCSKDCHHSTYIVANAFELPSTIDI